MTTEPRRDDDAPANNANDPAPRDDERESVDVQFLKAELEQVRGEMLRDRADLENQRKRIARELESARRFANERLLTDLLPLFDSMEAGLAAAADADPLRAGLELTLRQLHRIAESNGLSEVAPGPGDAFDPERHQAMSMAEAPGIPPGTVAQLFQKGYVLNERLLRPALVVVARQD